MHPWRILSGMFVFLILAGCVQSPAPLPNTSEAEFPPPPAALLNGSSVSPYRFQHLPDDDFRLGNDSAPVVIVEFGDFQCPFTRKWWTESFERLEEDYIQTGKVQFVYRDYPLVIHPSGQLSAEAVECAREQGRWREMYDRLFLEQNKLGAGTVSFHRPDLEQWAQRIEGLNMSAFRFCLDNGTYRQEVWSDYSDATRLGINSTPTFIIGERNGSGEILRGASSYSFLREKIRALLED